MKGIRQTYHGVCCQEFQCSSGDWNTAAEKKYGRRSRNFPPGRRRLPVGGWRLSGPGRKEKSEEIILVEDFYDSTDVMEENCEENEDDCTTDEEMCIGHNQ